MQYEAEIKSYVRVKNDQNKNIKSTSQGISYMAIMLIVLMGFFLSRVVVPMNFSIIKSIAPFGVAYLLFFYNKYNYKEMIAALIGTVLGYLTVINTVKEMPVYIFLCLVSIGFNYVPLKKRNKSFLNILKLSLFFVLLIVYNMLALEMDFLGAGAIALLIISFIIPGYFLLNYSMQCISEINNNHYFNSEEIISIEFLLSLVIVGIGTFSIMDVYLRGIMAVGVILLFTYIVKDNLGATIGLIMGLMVGIATKNLTYMVTVYGISALAASIFKEGGKILTYLAFNLTFILMSFSSGALNRFVIYELVIGSTIFLLIPNKIIEKLRVEFDGDRKYEDFSEFHFKKMKDELTKRLRDFTEVLSAMSLTLNTMVENEKLVSKNKGEALINNLADRVCSDCDFKKVCWKREMHETYSAFAELIGNFEEERMIFPIVLEKKCLKKATLLKATDEIVSNHFIQETIKQRLGEGRKLLSGHLNNMSLTVGEIVDDFNKEISLSTDVERTIRRELNRNAIKFKDLICYEDKDGRINIKINMLSCNGTEHCVKDVLPIINNAIGKIMTVGSECKINPKTKCCEILIEEAPKFHVSSHVALASKEGEKYTGDSYSIMKSRDGHHMALLCDGMGSGSSAGAESKVTVELMEKFSEVGFNEITAIDTINSIMAIKFSEEEKFSTLDMQKINLYDGSIKFIKVGAVESFIKKGKHIEVIESKTLPFGVLDSPDIDILEEKLKGGEFVVTISDGILDVNADGSLDNSWIIELLRTSRAKTAKELSNDILTKAKELAGGKAKDDMTVLVSKIYSI